MANTSQLKNTKSIAASEWAYIQKRADEAANKLPQGHVRKRARARFDVIASLLTDLAKTGAFSGTSDLEGLAFIHLTEADWQDNWNGTHEYIGEAALNRNAKITGRQHLLFVTGEPAVTNAHLITAGYDVLGTFLPIDSPTIFFIVPDDEQPVCEFTPDLGKYADAAYLAHHAAFVAPRDCGISFDDFEDAPTVVASRTAAAKAHSSHMSDYDWNDTSGLYIDEPQAGDDAPDWYYEY